MGVYLASKRGDEASFGGFAVRLNMCVFGPSGGPSPDPPSDGRTFSAEKRGCPRRLLPTSSLGPGDYRVKRGKKSWPRKGLHQQNNRRLTNSVPLHNTTYSLRHYYSPILPINVSERVSLSDSSRFRKGGLLPRQEYKYLAMLPLHGVTSAPIECSTINTA